VFFHRPLLLPDQVVEGNSCDAPRPAW